MADDRSFGGYANVGDADYTGNEARRSDYRSSSAWEYEAAGRLGDNRDQRRDRSYSGQEYDRQYGQRAGYSRGRDYGDRGYGEGGFGSRYSESSYNRGQGQGGGAYGDYGQGNSGAGQNYGGYRDRDYGGATGGQGYGGQSYGGGQNYGTDRDRSYGGGERQRDWNGDDQRGNFRQQGSSWDRGGGQNHRDYGRQQGRPRDYGSPEDRGFFDRAGDEVRSWFGDDEAQRRREMDQRYDERRAREQGNDRSSPSPFGGHRDDHDYHHWRQSQIDSLDRDYDEYRSENRQKFHNEFSAWRTDRQGQRDLLKKVDEHMDVVGSDDSHVGTVDKVRGDRILLTKSDQDAGGRHHSIPSRWIDKVEDNKVHLRKTADEAKAHWRDEERNSAFFGDDNNDRTTGTTQTTNASGTTGNNTGTAGTNETSTDLNRSFSGTY